MTPLTEERGQKGAYMEIKEAIYGRRSIRKYKDTPLKKEEVAEIIAAGMAAPSGVNLQPWYFVVVQSEEAMEDVKEIMKEAAIAMVPSLKERFAKHPEVVKETENFLLNLGHAPMCILAFLDKPGHKKAESTMIQSVAAAIQNMLLTAHGLGIGSCWMTAPLETGVDHKFQERFAPDKGDMIAMITLGYPEEERTMPRRKPNRFEIV